jgi:hypothetical protein
MFRNRTTHALVAGSLATLGLTGCSDDPNPAPAGGGGMAVDTAGVRVVHASSDAPAVDVYVEGQPSPIVKAAKFGDTSAYLSVPAGKYNFELRPAGASVMSAPAYSTGPLDVPAKSKITAMAVGLLASTEDASKFRVLALAEGFKGSPDNATVRIVHASPDAPTVGVDVGTDDPTKPEVPSLARFADTGADGVALPAGQKLQVGIAAGGARVTAFTTPELPAGGELFLVATGRVGQLARETDGFSILAVGPQGTIGFVRQNPVVYALHASPDAPTVDIFAGPSELADNLAFGQLSNPIQLPPGSYSIDFFAGTEGSARPAGAPAASNSTPELAAGQSYLVAATGFVARPSPNAFQLAAVAEGFDLSDPTKAALRAFHASPDAPKVDVGTEANSSVTPVFAGAEFPNATDAKGVLVTPATLPIGVTPFQSNSTIVARFDVPTSPGTRAFVVAAGALSPQMGEQSFRLLAVDTQAKPWTVTSISPK